MGKVQLPKNKESRRQLYCFMLDLPKKNKLTYNELEKLCLARGYLRKD